MSDGQAETQREHRVPNIIGQFEACYEDTLINLTGPLAERTVSFESQCTKQKIAGRNRLLAPTSPLGRHSRTVPSLRPC